MRGRHVTRAGRRYTNALTLNYFDPLINLTLCSKSDGLIHPKYVNAHK